MTTAILYEVTVNVGEGSRSEFEKYMVETHIPDVVATGCFLGAVFSDCGSGVYRTSYEAPDRKSVELYFDKYAERLRSEVLRAFPEGVSVAGRAELKVVARFDPQIS